jgi:hypothetical protein
MEPTFPKLPREVLPAAGDGELASLNAKSSAHGGMPLPATRKTGHVNSWLLQQEAGCGIAESLEIDRGDLANDSVATDSASVRPLAPINSVSG